MAQTLNLYEIPVTATSSWYRQPVTLAGQQVVFEFQFNERQGLWYVDILDAAETPLAQGIALVAARDLLAAHRSRVFADGALFVYDTTGKGENPGFASFSLTHRLLFASP